MGAMGRSKLSDDQWLALFSEEKTGVPRSVLAAKYDVSRSAINIQAVNRRLTKRETGAPDHRKRPPGGWPDDRPLPQSAVGMTPRQWRQLLARYQAGESPEALSAAYGPSVAAIHSHAATVGMRKCDAADAVYNWFNGRDVSGRAFRFDPADPEATEAALLDRGRAAAVEGRTTDFIELERARRSALRWCASPRLFPADDGDGGDDASPAPPIVLRPAQRPPGGDWSTWLFLGGRGAGKTLAGASWLADQAELLGAGGRLALVGPTLHDVREVMIEGPSGLRSLPRWTRATRPVYQPSRRRLRFANGCIAQAFSAEDPDSLRGPQFSAAWADEFCAWPAVGARGAGETLALLRMGLRLPLSRRGEGRGARGEGEDGTGGASWRTVVSPLDPRPSPLDAPKLVVTTTPRPTRALIALRDEASCALTHAGTAENAEHLSPGFLEELRSLYGGTRREAQEIEGLIVDLAGALFTAEMMAVARGEGRGARGEVEEGTDGASGRAVLSPLDPRPSPLDRIIVALDPTTTATGDACGIIVAGSRRRADGVREAVVLADRSAAGLSPDQWGRRAVQAAREFNAGAVVAEVNQGGDMVRAVLKTAGCSLRIREVRASRGKRVRAEPVAALYEQGRVRHAPADGVALSALEEELMAFAGEMEGAGSLDRADALVWAVTDLLIDAPEGERGPRVRRL